MNPDTFTSLPIFEYELATSTNDLAWDYALSHPGDDAVFIADAQSAGRGRRGRTFHSPANTGIYVSILLQKKSSRTEATHLTCLAAVAVCRAIQKVCAIEVRIKWVNDIYHEGKKICGILTEGKTLPQNQELSCAIVGIGLNLFAPHEGFPDEIRNRAGALFNTAPDEYGISSEESSKELRKRLYLSIIDHFFELYNICDKSLLAAEYRARSMLIGKNVEITTASLRQADAQNTQGFVRGIDNDFRLLVEFPDGTTGALSSGEVTVLV